MKIYLFLMHAIALSRLPNSYQGKVSIMPKLVKKPKLQEEVTLFV
jgi:hypothetical protein